MNTPSTRIIGLVTLSIGSADLIVEGIVVSTSHLTSPR